jgi:hypothetical protein
MAKPKNTKVTKKVDNLAVKDVDAAQAKAVAGGRKAGGGQEDYLIVKMNDILITG